jgi:hypothetical protein
VEVGAGYRFTRDALAKIVYQQSELVLQRAAAEEVRRPSLWAAQVSVAF